MTVRPATGDDLEAIAAVGVAAGERFRAIDDPRISERADDPPFEVDELAHHLATGGLLVVDEDGEVAGFLVVEQVGAAAHVEEVAVRPASEGRGHGTALLEAAAVWARHEGLAAVTLTTFRDVPWNRPFYERRGFRVLDEAELDDGLRARRESEAAMGLDPDIRVVMRRDL